MFTLACSLDNASIAPQNIKFEQTAQLTTAGIAVHPYGAIIIPASQASTEITIVGTLNGTKYTGDTKITSASTVGDKVTMNKG